MKPQPVPPPFPETVATELKARYGSDTRGLTKAVAMRMFMDGGSPTCLAVRAVTGRGSMTTIAAALDEWQQELRRLTRAAVETPGLPPEVADPFKVALKNLWSTATQASRAAFDDEREKSLALVRAHEASAAEARTALDAANRKITEAAERIARRDATIADAATTIARERNRSDKLEVEAKARIAETATLREKLAAVSAERDSYKAMLRDQNKGTGARKGKMPRPAKT